MANGALGALAAWLENKKRVAGRQLRDLVESPNDFGRMQAARFKQDQAEYMSDPASGLDFIAGPLGGLAGVVKAKGGNWMPGSVEKALSSLKRGYVDESDFKDAVERFGLDQALEMRANLEASPFVRKELPLNKWIEGPLQKYVKTQMATPEDPVRALAEQGILHYVPEMQGNTSAMRNRVAVGTPQMGTAKAQLARDWEDATDNMVRGRMLGSEWRQGSGLPTRSVVEAEGGTWAVNAPDDTMIYDLLQDRVSTRELPGKLGFDHLTDELRNALNPESGLPRNLLIRPEQMQQMGMEKAVRHVAAINDWRAAQKAAANQELASKAMAVREYAENNPKGLRWVELGKDTPELEKQLKYEGDTMGHCVGGYCDDVISGRSRIFSLRDAKGEPHVTVEVSPGMKRADASTDMFMNHVLPKEQTDAMVAKMIREGTFNRESLDAAVKAMPEYQAWAVGEDPSSIVQIKGKANQAPKDEYLPFVQDFVKNSPLNSPWGAVGDIENTGFRRRKDVFNPTELDYLKARGVDPSEYLLPNEIDEYQKLFGQSKASSAGDREADYADGGLVHNNPFGDVTPHAMLNRIIDAYNQL